LEYVFMSPIEYFINGMWSINGSNIKPEKKVFHMN
jgi:hypothetical protein